MSSIAQQPPEKRLRLYAFLHFPSEESIDGRDLHILWQHCDISETKAVLADFTKLGFVNALKNSRFADYEQIFPEQNLEFGLIGKQNFSRANYMQEFSRSKMNEIFEISEKMKVLDFKHRYSMPRVIYDSVLKHATKDGFSSGTNELCLNKVICNAALHRRVRILWRAVNNSPVELLTGKEFLADLLDQGRWASKADLKRLGGYSFCGNCGEGRYITERKLLESDNAATCKVQLKMLNKVIQRTRMSADENEKLINVLIEFDLIKEAATMSEALGLELLSLLDLLLSMQTKLPSKFESDLANPDVFRSMLAEAAGKSSMTSVRFLWERVTSYRIDLATIFGDWSKSPTRAALQAGNEEASRFLLERDPISLTTPEDRRNVIKCAMWITGLVCDLLGDPRFSAADFAAPVFQAIKRDQRVPLEMFLEKIPLEKLGDLVDSENGDSVLTAAIKCQKNWEFVNMLVEHNVALDKKDRNGESAVAAAARSGPTDLVKVLVLDKGQPADSKDKYNETPLSRALNKGRKDVVDFLLPLSESVFRDPDASLAALHSAINGGHIEVVKNLIEAGASCDATKSEGWNALHVAVVSENLEMVQLIADKVKDLHATTNNSMTALMLGMTKSVRDAAKTTQIALFLIDRNISVIRRANENYCGDLPLIVAANTKNLELTKRLLRHPDVDVNARNLKDGNSALMEAITTSESIAAYLVAHNAALDLPNKKGTTPLMMATEIGRFEIVSLLVNKQVNVNATDNTGQTALMIARSLKKEEHARIAKLLEKYGTVDIASMTPEMKQQLFIGALTCQDLGKVKKLVEKHGFDCDAPLVNVTNYQERLMEGDNALTLALRRRSDIEVIKYLLGKTKLPDLATLWEHALKVYEFYTLARYLIKHKIGLEAQNKQSQTPLIQAARDQKFEIVKALVEAQVNTSAVDDKGNTALLSSFDSHHIYSRQSSEVAGYLIQHGIAVHIANNDGITPMIKAARTDNIAIIKCLLEKGPIDELLKEKDNNGLTALQHALIENRTEIAKLLMKHDKAMSTQEGKNKALLAAAQGSLVAMVKRIIGEGGNCNARDQKNGETVLIKAARAHRLENAKVIIPNVDDISAVDNDGNTALMAALEQISSSGVWERYGQDKKQIDMISWCLIEHGISLVSNKRGETPLMQAAARDDRIELVRHLLDIGLKPEAEDACGNTALIFALKSSVNSQVAAFLFERDESYKGNTIKTSKVFLAAVEGGHQEIARQLIVCEGVDCNVRDEVTQQTALMKTAKHDNRNVAEMLVKDFGADLNLVDNNSNNVLHHSATTRFGVAVAEYFIELPEEKTRDILDARNKRGITPYMVARAKFNNKVADRLLATGRVDKNARDANGDTIEEILKRSGYQIGELLLN